MSRIPSEGVTPPSSLIRTHASDQNPPYRFRVRLIRKVFAGCCQPLLEVGPSRRYLHNLCKGAWTRTPPRSQRSCPFGRPCARLGRFDRKDIGLAPESTNSAREKISLQCNFNREGISRLQSFTNVQAPLLARPPGCTYRCDKHRAAGPFTSRNEHGVTRPDLSRFSMNRDIATHPKRTN